MSEDADRCFTSSDVGSTPLDRRRVPRLERPLKREWLSQAFEGLSGIGYDLAQLDKVIWPVDGGGKNEEGLGVVHLGGFEWYSFLVAN